uniref:Uncharacterized protein n=1 Tax=Ficus carica TaxID=3494 RepID=A0AA88JDI5_FICCA|nr:hypothetical protein TIFTF001_038220 [Ficus carica]
MREVQYKIKFRWSNLRKEFTKVVAYTPDGECPTTGSDAVLGEHGQPTRTYRLTRHITSPPVATHSDRVCPCKHRRQQPYCPLYRVRDTWRQSIGPIVSASLRPNHPPGALALPLPSLISSPTDLSIGVPTATPHRCPHHSQGGGGAPGGLGAGGPAGKRERGWPGMAWGPVGGVVADDGWSPASGGRSPATEKIRVGKFI